MLVGNFTFCMAECITYTNMSMFHNNHAALMVIILMANRSILAALHSFWLATLIYLAPWWQEVHVNSTSCPSPVILPTCLTIAWLPQYYNIVGSCRLPLHTGAWISLRQFLSVKKPHFDPTSHSWPMHLPEKWAKWFREYFIKMFCQSG